MPNKATFRTEPLVLAAKAEVAVTLRPVGPVGPVGPVAPAAPAAPVGPAAPAGPVAPAAPVGPVGPVAPVAPVAPAGPVGPAIPESPSGRSACGAGGPGCPGSSRGAGRAAGRARGAGRAGGPSGPLHGRGRQRTLHLRFEEELVLSGSLQHAADALVGRQHVADRGGRTAEARNGTQNILQFLALGVEDMAQSEFLHGDGREDLVDRILPLDGRVNVGKTWHRHRAVSPFKPWAQTMAYQNTGIEQKALPGEAPTASYAPGKRRVPASQDGFSRIGWNGGSGFPAAQTRPGFEPGRAMEYLICLCLLFPQTGRT